VNRIANTCLLLAAAALSACNTGGAKGVRFVDGKSGQAQAEPIRNLTGAEIPPAIIGKTFQYTRPDGNGFVTYNADGTFTFQDDAKGTGTGKWLVNGEQFCESFGAGAPTDCGEFKSTGDAYFAAKSRLVEMKS
jgi:hypothetical protein